MAIEETAVSNRANHGVMAILSLSMLLQALGTSIANIALPSLAQAFSAPFYQVQWVVIAYLATMTVAVALVGRLGDRHGLRRMHLLGLGIFGLASLLCGLAPSLELLIGARALQGIGAAFLMTLSLALVRGTASAAGMGRAMGLLGTVSALGTALGPTLGGAVLSATGWQGIFLVQFPVTVLTLVLGALWLPGDAMEAGARRPDAGGTWPAGLPANLLVNLLVAAVMMTTLVVGPFYLRQGLGLSVLAVGLVMSVGPLISILCGIPSGQAVDTWGAQRVLATGLVMLATGTLLLAVLPGLLGGVGYGLAIAVLTPGYQLFQAANNTAVMADVPLERRGTISGTLSLSRNIGLILGASLMGAFFAWGVGTGEVDRASPAAIAGGMRQTFLLAAGLMLVALWVMLARPRRVG